MNQRLMLGALAGVVAIALLPLTERRTLHYVLAAAGGAWVATKVAR